ncbi:MAG TPA: CPBP family intramembrane glutamic endopeptidase [Chloroflexota bacterium]|nr:CPBP family intramembrane glutamic endopeptidase [Chloroflexota bacterium]
MRRALIGLAAAIPLWAFVFRGRPGSFWARMTFATGALGLYALRSRPELRQELPARQDLAAGALSAAGLYAIFQVGDRAARRVMPHGEQDIQNVYRYRTLAPRPLIAALLVGIIGPGEELFWRGLVQHAAIARWGRLRGTIAGAAAYGGTHLVTGNPTLTGAASVAGAYWGGEYALRGRLSPVLVSHILWDLWIFLIAPTPTGR